MSNALIFAHGTFNPPRIGRAWFPDGAVRIAADGGAEHCLALGWTPDVLIGDFDSLPAETVDRLASDGVEVIRHPVDKDATDLELAIQLAISRGILDLIVLGAVGDRWDQSMASFLLLERYADSTRSIRLIDGAQEAFLIQPGDEQVIHGQPGDVVSLIPLLGDSSGITTRALAFPLRDERLLFGTTRGVSNVLLAETASVKLREGELVCVVIHVQEVEA